MLMLMPTFQAWAMSQAVSTLVGCGVSRATVYRWQSGERTPSERSHAILVAAFPDNPPPPVVFSIGGRPRSRAEDPAGRERDAAVRWLRNQGLEGAADGIERKAHLEPC